MGGKTEVFYYNVEILLHHCPTSFHDEQSKEADEGVSSQGQFIHRPQCFDVYDRKGNNQLDEKEWLLTSMVTSPQWTTVWDYLHRPSCW